MHEEIRRCDTIAPSDRLLYEGLHELGYHMLGSAVNSCSISYLCLMSGITYDERNRLFEAFKKTVQETPFDQLSVSLFRKVICETIKAEESWLNSEMSDHSVKNFIKAFARNMIPELMAFASTFSEEAPELS